MLDSPFSTLSGVSPQPNADFNFLMGIWHCRHRFLVKRLADCRDWIEFDGSCAARKTLGGWGNCDESVINLPGDHYRGMGLRTWDPAKRKWTSYWLDSRCPGRLGPPLVGGFEKEVGVFYGEGEFKGRAMRVRCLWSRITSSAARWEQAFSLDEGKGWETNWYIDFTRV